LRLPSNGSGACRSERSKPAHAARAADRTARPKPKPGQINRRCTLRNEKKPVPERACCCSVKTQRRASSCMIADNPELTSTPSAIHRPNIKAATLLLPPAHLICPVKTRCSHQRKPTLYTFHGFCACLHYDDACQMPVKLPKKTMHLPVARAMLPFYSLTPRCR